MDGSVGAVQVPDQEIPVSHGTMGLHGGERWRCDTRPAQKIVYW